MLNKIMNTLISSISYNKKLGWAVCTDDCDDDDDNGRQKKNTPVSIPHNPSL